MIRLLFLVLVAAVVLHAIGVPPALALGAAAFGIIGVFVVSGARLRCPACRKRVKLGATACSYCGRVTTREQPR